MLSLICCLYLIFCWKLVPYLLFRCLHKKWEKLEGTWVLLVVGLDDEMGANTFLEKKWVFGGTSCEGKSNDFGGLRF